MSGRRGPRGEGLLDSLVEGLQDAADALAEGLHRLGEERRQAYRAAAAELGLEADAQGSFVGAWDGVPVRRRSVDRGGKNATDWWTVTEYQLAAALPGHLAVHPRGLLEQLSEAFGARDVEVGSPLDRALWVRVAAGQHDEARALLCDPAVLDRLEALRQTDAQWELEDAALTVSFRGRHDQVGARGLRLGAEVARAVDRLLVPPWRELARDLGSELHPAAPRLAGHHGGVPVRVEVRLRKGAPTTWLLAWFAPTLPDGTRVMHRARLSRGRELGDPILDPMLRAESADLGELGRRLGQDAVRGPLLEVLHGFPGSSLRHDRVMLRVPGRAGPALPRRVRLVTELASALAAAC